jgi:electron transfer flavoprotein alpha/beta subunit
MNILVCFKPAPDLEMFVRGDWVVNQDFRIDVSFVKRILNSYDQSALEIALRLSEACAGLKIPRSLGAMTVTGPEVTSILKYLNALQFNAVVRIDTPEEMRFKPLAIASILTRYILKCASQDVLLMGVQSDIGQNAQTPLLTAEMLGWPCITQVIGVEPADRHHLTVTCLVDDGQLQQTIQLPCVLSVGEAPGTSLRVPTLRDRMRYGRRTIQVLPKEDFEPYTEGPELSDLQIIDYARPAVFIEGETAEAKAIQLYDRSLKERLSRL